MLRNGKHVVFSSIIIPAPRGIRKITVIIHKLRDTVFQFTVSREYKRPSKIKYAIRFRKKKKIELVKQFSDWDHRMIDREAIKVENQFTDETIVISSELLVNIDSS